MKCKSSPVNIPLSEGSTFDKTSFKGCGLLGYASWYTDNLSDFLCQRFRGHPVHEVCCYSTETQDFFFELYCIEQRLFGWCTNESTRPGSNPSKIGSMPLWRKVMMLSGTIYFITFFMKLSSMMCEIRLGFSPRKLP